MDSKKPPISGITPIPSAATDDVPPLSPDREHLLAKTFEDANLDDMLSPQPNSVVSEAADAVQELVAEAAGTSSAIDIGMSTGDTGAIESGSVSGGGSIVPDSPQGDMSNALDLSGMAPDNSVIESASVSGGGSIVPDSPQGDMSNALDLSGMAPDNSVIESASVSGGGSIVPDSPLGDMSNALDLSGMAPDNSVIESASVSGGGSIVPESNFQSSEGGLDIGGGGDELVLQLSQRPKTAVAKPAANHGHHGAHQPEKHTAPKSAAKPVAKPVQIPAAPVAVAAAPKLPAAAPAPVQQATAPKLPAAPAALPEAQPVHEIPTLKTANFEIQKGADSQSFACADHQDSTQPKLVPQVDAHEMPIVKELCATTEANTSDSEGADIFLMENHTAESVVAVARAEMAERFMLLVACEMSFNDLVEAVLTVLLHGVHAQAGSILEFDAAKDEFFFRSSIGGGDPEQLKAFRVPAKKGIVGHVAESRQSLLIRDVDDSELQLRAISMSVGFETKTCIAAPIMIANQLYGVVELFNKQGADYFDDKDLEVVEAGLRLASKVLEVRFLMAELYRRAG